MSTICVTSVSSKLFCNSTCTARRTDFVNILKKDVLCVSKFERMQLGRAIPRMSESCTSVA